jgi:hypothetical protein
LRQQADLLSNLSLNELSDLLLYRRRHGHGKSLELLDLLLWMRGLQQNSLKLELWLTRRLHHPL